MRYRWETYLQPLSIQEALDQLDENLGNSGVIAGGTDLIVKLEKSDGYIPVIVDISRIPDLKEISINEHSIKIGAGVTLSEIEQSNTLKTHAPYLVAAARVIGSRQIRNMATLVGNVANASPAADGVLPLLALDSQVLLRARNGERQLPLETFLVGPGKTRCNLGEIIISVQFPLPGKTTYGSFQKLGLRKAMNIAVANVCVVAEMAGSEVLKARVALGAVGPTALRAVEAEATLAGKLLDDALIAEIGELCTECITPIDDLRSSSRYRKKVIQALVARCLTDVRHQIM